MSVPKCVGLQIQAKVKQMAFIKHSLCPSSTIRRKCSQRQSKARSQGIAGVDTGNSS